MIIGRTKDSTTEWRKTRAWKITRRKIEKEGVSKREHQGCSVIYFKNTGI